jgi:hypothetical protein
MAADCKSDAEGRQAHGSRSDVVMSGIVNSGRQRGLGNVAANHLKANMDTASRIIWIGQS